MQLDRDLLRRLPPALRVEIEENARQKPLTQSELARVQRRLLAELRRHATPGARTDLKGSRATSEKTFSEVRGTSIVGKIYNESHKQVEKRLAIVAAAEAEPERYGRLLEDMDQTGRVDGAYRELRQREARAAAYEARVRDGATVEDLRALAASGKRFAVIYADPPSRYDSYFGADVGGGADRHYDTMTVDELKAMGPLIRSLAAKDCALLYWTSGPQCANALEILKWWEFQYATWAFMWVKTNPSSGAPELEDLRPEDLHWGNGWATRPNAEVVLLAKRGAPRRLACDVHQVVVAPAAAHSQKPEEVRRRIERLFAGPYLELFGRRPVPGWTVWGNEISRSTFLQAAGDEYVQAAE